MKKDGEDKRAGTADRVIKVRLRASGELVSEDWGDVREFGRLKARRVSLILGPGEVEPTDRRHSVYGLRNLFLERIRGLELGEERERKEAEEAKKNRTGRPPAPHEVVSPRKPLIILRELAGRPYEELMRSGASDEDVFLLEEDALARDGSSLPDHLTALREAVLDWTRFSNLRAGFGREEAPRGGGWCAARAYDTLWLWRESKEAFEKLEWENGSRFVMEVISDEPAPESVGPVHTFPAWFPDSEPLTSYEKAVREKARRLVGEFLASSPTAPLSMASSDTAESWVDDIVSAMVEAARAQAVTAYLGVSGVEGETGWEKVRTSRTLLKKIDWTIDVTVRGMGLDEVATAERGDPNPGDLSDGVTEVSELIDLRKRDEFKRGRRKGSKDLPSSDRKK